MITSSGVCLTWKGPSFVTVRFGRLEVAFSYATPIWFSDDSAWRVRPNSWSATTGRHMKALLAGNGSQLRDDAEWVQEFDAALVTVNL